MEGIGKRIMDLRISLGLSQDEFGKRIGITRSSVSGFESGRRNPSEQTLLSMSREFGARIEYLRDGIEPKFKPEGSAIDALQEERRLSPEARVLVDVFSKMDPGSQATLISFVKQAAAALENMEIEVEVDSYRRELIAEKKAKEKSSVSEDGSETENKMEA